MDSCVLTAGSTPAASTKPETLCFQGISGFSLLSQGFPLLRVTGI